MQNQPVSHLPDNLLRAFAAADYRVSIDRHEYAIRIGREHPQLDRALGRRPWGILTACNPGGRLADDEDNRQQQKALERAVEEAGWRHWPGRNLDPHHQWPQEPSLLIADVDADALARLASRFGQAAIVTGQPGGRAELRACR